METYNNIIQFIDTNLIFSLLPAIISLYIIKLVFRNKFKTKMALGLISYLIIFYTSIILLHFVFRNIVAPEDVAFTQRSTGRYAFAYWLMVLFATIVPFTLLIKKLDCNFLYVMFIALLMKIGFYFERFVILVTSFNRDYAPFDTQFTWMNYPTLITILLLRGLILAIVILFVAEMIQAIRARTAVFKHN